MFFPKPSFSSLNSGGFIQKSRDIATNNASTEKDEICLFNNNFLCFRAEL